MTDYTIRLDEINARRLEETVEAMQMQDGSQSVDDCIDQIFATGLVAVYSTLTLEHFLEEA